MVEAKLSERAQKILTWLTSSPSPLGGEGFRLRSIRQESLAEKFSCSRRTIGRALNELKRAGLLVDLNQRDKNRCKMYQVIVIPGSTRDPWIPHQVRNDKTLTPPAQMQWEKFEKTFRIVFTMPELPAYYAQVTWALAGVKEETELWTKTWAGLRVLAGHRY